MKLLDLVPSWVWAAALSVVLAFAGTSYVRMKIAQTELATYRADVAENTRKTEAEARAKEQAMRKQADRIANDQAKKETELAAAAARADAVAASLRDEIDRLNASPAPTDPRAAALAREATTARKLLGACAERYRGVAKGADDLRGQVSGLQDYATSVCKQP